MSRFFFIMCGAVGSAALSFLFGPLADALTGTFLAFISICAFVGGCAYEASPPRPTGGEQ